MFTQSYFLGLNDLWLTALVFLLGIGVVVLCLLFVEPSRTTVNKMIEDRKKENEKRH